MPKIPLGSTNPDDPSDPLGPPLPAIEIPPEELAALGLSNESPLSQKPIATSVPDKVAAFVERVTPAATQAAEALNVPVEAVISQWALESGWGGSELAQKYNNLGGIKALGTSWKGEKVEMPSYEKDRSVKEVSPFRVYKTLGDYATDYTALLNNQRYAPVRGTNTVRDFGMALTKAGYSQDSPESYASQLESIARRVAPLIKR
jgi:flagellum-specific peptidoglycan hydrolase FlgJ